MKRIIAWILICMSLLAAGCAQAESPARSYTFDLSANGQHELHVQKGDIITVVFTLMRTDAASAYTMYAMQDEIRYDDAFVRIIEDASIVTSEVRTKDLPLVGGERAFYMNYVSFADGVEWKANQLVGTFQMEILADAGVTRLRNENYKVSVRDGSESYPATADDLTLIVSDECTVRFETNGGTPLESVITRYGDRLQRPKDPVKAGWHIAGWYRDIDLVQEWDFEKDIVESNMTLYAKWVEGDPESSLIHRIGEWLKSAMTAIIEALGAWWPWWLLIPGALIVLLLILLLLGRKRRVIFETNGGAPIDPIRVRKNETLKELPVPVRGYSVFCGWYKDAAMTDPWYAGVDKVKKRKTKLYAKWL